MSSRDTSRPSSQRRRHGFLLMVLVGLVSAPASVGLSEDPSGLPELVRTKHRTFAIPFRLPKSQDPDADATPQRIVLNVSKDLGGSWEQAGEASPGQGTLTYTAADDGEYWFRLRAIDRKGRTRGGEGPDMRVLVDAAGPRVAARVWKGADGEILCRYAAADDSLRLESLKLEYRGRGDQTWKTVATEGILARQSPAHLVGEEIWWAGEKVETLAVRITITDASGNQTVRQFSLLPADPGVDQTGLARELGVPPLPGGTAADSAQAFADVPAALPSAGGTAPPAADAAGATPPGGWSAEPGVPWSDGRPRTNAGSAGPLDRSRSVLVKQSADTAATTRPLIDAPAQMRLATPTQDPVAAVTRADATAAAGSGPLEYKGRPLLLSRSRRFSWDYETPADVHGRGPIRVELWSTRDGGVTWQRTATDEDGRSPIDVQLPAAGLYGFRLEVFAGQADAEGGPRSGESPDTWVGIDEEPPQVELLGVDRDEAVQPPTLVIRYAARDSMLGQRSVRLLYSPNPEGPWATITDGLEARGDYRWQPGRSVPARVYLRAEATDAAGNVGFAATPDALPVATTRFVGRLGGLRAEPPPAP